MWWMLLTESDNRIVDKASWIKLSMIKRTEPPFTHLQQLALLGGTPSFVVQPLRTLLCTFDFDYSFLCSPPFTAAFLRGSRTATE